MRWLSDERGATLVFIAVLLVGLLAMAAFAVDTGALYAERRQLQSGADAAALAIAYGCADDPATCTYSAAATIAGSYADANADDAATTVEAIQLDPGKVRVEVLSEDTEGNSIMSPFFAQVVGFEGTEVRAQATAQWGIAGSTPSVPLIVSDCEWFDPARPPLQEEAPYGGEPWIFIFHEGGHAGTCEHSTSGFDLPGGFGWLNANAGPCQALATVGGVAPADTGASPSNGCSPELVYDLMFEQVVFLPYYDEVSGEGSGVSYHVSGLGAFYVTGYNFGGGYKEPAGSPPCSGSLRCIAGHFVTGTADTGDFGGPDRGLSLVKLTN